MEVPMSKTARVLRRVLLALAIVATGLAASTPLEAQAMAAVEPVLPGGAKAARGYRLERLWARQRRMHARLGRVFDHVERRIKWAEEMIACADESGKDTSRLQSALDSFAASVKGARPLFVSARGLINSHRGFDSGGRITDFELAADTVSQMALHLKEIRRSLHKPAVELREAIREFRHADPT